MRSECNKTLIMYYRNSSVVVDLLWDRYHVVPQNVFLVFL